MSIVSQLDPLLANAPLPPYDILIGTMDRNERSDFERPRAGEPRSVNVFMSEWIHRAKWLFLLDIDEYVAPYQALVAAARALGHDENPLRPGSRASTATWGVWRYPGSAHLRWPLIRTPSRSHIHKATFSDNRELVELLRKKGENVIKLEAN
ncbi:BZ3500_MvSof-1268-A1-R1_Chr1-3g01615 [Microbotryum saponariae]|uniref:BZ3500_MvSof-1268-A1-R1_Chr1-3g01615 protein n=1 Tax=Microbotryum saponariae TaxID=289078 RepID=A0A2X0KRE4_9BASI|nr:BZ3500_MvSof-1268-A1-R1_Chr1-3g01615 [Microbotryum saponariae]SCZ94146.1 BZ3501_MvSof-1269-A2-R1_Chr1-3g01216 [Microbotryum saponariae]